MKRVVNLLILLLLVGVGLSAQDILSAEQYLAKVGERYGTIKDYSARIVIRSGNNEMIGQVIHRPPNLLRIDFSQPEEQVIAFSGDELIVYLPEYRAVLSQTVSANNAAAAPAMASAAGLETLRRNYAAAYEIGPDPMPLEEGSTEMVIKLSLTRRSLSEGFRELRIAIDPATRMIRRIDGRTLSEETIRFDFTSILIDQGIPEARFIYDTPPQANRYNNFLFKESD